MTTWWTKSSAYIDLSILYKGANAGQTNTNGIFFQLILHQTNARLATIIITFKGTAVVEVFDNEKASLARSLAVHLDLVEPLAL